MGSTMCPPTLALPPLKAKTLDDHRPPTMSSPRGQTFGGVSDGIPRRSCTSAELLIATQPSRVAGSDFARFIARRLRFNSVADLRSN